MLREVIRVEKLSLSSARDISLQGFRICGRFSERRKTLSGGSGKGVIFKPRGAAARCRVMGQCSAIAESMYYSPSFLLYYSLCDCCEAVDSTQITI